ncbi:PREDICTED: dynein light chain Tctex-type 1 [Myotis davidii]|uniref:dynein light chain Tctex-type 1 n=1 Tax=Myotis davidii TaxID=225400 RepID=UPI0007670205|nr:PREDICTED: dynein light chain Tctex-type 1 [Myotis davidii]
MLEKLSSPSAVYRNPPPSPYDPYESSCRAQWNRGIRTSTGFGPSAQQPDFISLLSAKHVATTFVVDEVSNIVKEAIESAIGGNAYQHSKVNQWTTNVVEQTLSQLTKLGKPFKYIVTCIIMQKNGAGLHTASSCFWDSSTDGSCTVRWENKTMYCIVSAFGLSI